MRDWQSCRVQVCVLNSTQSWTRATRDRCVRGGVSEAEICSCRATLVFQEEGRAESVEVGYTRDRVTSGAAAKDEEPFFTGYVDGRLRARANVTEIAQHGYLTPEAQWGDVERGNPLPYTLPPDERRAVGLERETWRLEIVADSDTDTKLGSPLTIAAAPRIDFDDAAEARRAARRALLKGVTCNNLGEPLGMGLWEGVPLRVLIWMARPSATFGASCITAITTTIRAQIFQSSLPIGRVLEEPPGELPVHRRLQAERRVPRQASAAVRCAWWCRRRTASSRSSGCSASC